MTKDDHWAYMVSKRDGWLMNKLQIGMDAHAALPFTTAIDASRFDRYRLLTDTVHGPEAQCTCAGVPFYPNSNVRDLKCAFHGDDAYERAERRRAA